MLMLLSTSRACSSNFRATPDALQAFQPNCGSSDQRCACCDDVNGNTLHQVFAASFSDKGLNEPRSLQSVHQVQGDAARDINSTSGENFQRKVAGFAGEDRDQYFDGCLTQFTGMLWVKGRIHDYFRMIFGRCDHLGNFRPLRCLLFVAKKFVNIGNTDSRTNTLNPHMTKTWQQILKQANLALVSRRKI